MQIEHVTEFFSFDEQTFVIELYRRFLGREPDESGLRYYLGRLALGHTRESVIDQILRSSEVKDRSSIRGLPQLIRKARFRRSWFGRFLGLFSIERRTQYRGANLQALMHISEHLRHNADLQTAVVAALNRVDIAVESLGARVASESAPHQPQGAKVDADLPLSRRDVALAFRQVLRRNPESEETIQAHRHYANIELLAGYLRQSEEYQSRYGKLSVPARRAYAVFCGALPVSDLEV